MIGAVASSSAAIAAVTQLGANGVTQQSPSALQPQAQAAASSPAIVSEVAKTSANGIITWQITYADGATATMTSSGPVPSSKVNIVV
jgi:hypothetical protein